jgi:hypothetical protein
MSPIAYTLGTLLRSLSSVTTKPPSMSTPTSASAVVMGYS